MSYATLINKINSIPEEYLDEVADYIEHVILENHIDSKATNTTNYAAFFGTIHAGVDGLAIQRSMRDEWN